MLYTMKDGIVDSAKERLLGKKTGISTGFHDLDQSLGGGLQDGFLYVLGGRPAMGKTSFALNLTSNICEQGKKVLYYSLEMNGENLIKRLIMLESMNDKAEYDDAVRKIKGYRLLVNDDSETLVEVIGAYTEGDTGGDPERDEDDADLIIIDYLQLLRTFEDKNDPEHDKLEYICRKLKEKAMERQIPVILLTNLSRTLEKRKIKNRRPLLCDLHECDPAAVYADVVMFLYRDEYYDPDTELKSIAEVRIAKNVTGLGSESRLAYIGCGRFCNMQNEEE